MITDTPTLAELKRIKAYYAEYVAKVEAKIKAAERKGRVENLDKWNDGTVIRWDQTSAGSWYDASVTKTLTYAALKAGDKWWITAQNGQQMTSAELHARLSKDSVTDVELLSTNRVIKQK